MSGWRTPRRSSGTRSCVRCENSGACPWGAPPFTSASNSRSRALQSAGGVQKKAAELLQIKPTTLHEMMKRLGVNSEVAAS